MDSKCSKLGLRGFITKAAPAEDSAHDSDCNCFDCQMLSNLTCRLEAVVETRFGLPSLEPDTEAAIEMVTTGLAALRRAKCDVLSANDTNMVASGEPLGVSVKGLLQRCYLQRT